MNKQVGKVLGIFLYVMFGCVFVIVEEILIAITLFKVEKAIMQNNSFTMLFPNLTPHFLSLEHKQRDKYVTYFTGIATHNNRRLSIMAREASIQLVYMLTLIIYGFFNQPVIELDYQGWKNPTAIWIGLLIWTLISTMLSGYSTFAPLLENLNWNSFRRYKRPATLSEQVVKIMQLLIHLFSASFLLFLSRSPIQQS